jgi:hypothetical protein
MKLQRFIQTTLSVMLCLIAENAWSNLVPNPGFEAYSSLPNVISQIDRAVPWNRPTLGTPDYFHTDALPPPNPDSSVDIPINFVGSQLPFSGSAYAGFSVFHNIPGNPAPNYREYIQSPLSAPLVANQRYTFSFHVSLADSSLVATSDLGAFFSVGAVGPIGSSANLPFTPQVINSSGILADKTGWSLVQGSFVAAGGEDHVIIGNFLDQSSTNFVELQPGTPHEAYYYIDGISLVESPAAVNKDIRNTTGLTANDVELLVEGTHSSVLSHFDGGFPSFTITPVGPNTQFRWSGLTVPNGTVKHIGIELPKESISILGVSWTFDGDTIGCAPQANADFDRSSGGAPDFIRFRNDLLDPCDYSDLFVGELSVEYYVDAPPLAELNAGGARSPIAVDSVVANPVLINSGGQAVLQIPDPPELALYAVLVYKVGTEASLSGPETTDDYVLVPIPPPIPKVPTLSEGGLIVLALTILIAGLVLRRGRLPRSQPV